MATYLITDITMKDLDILNLAIEKWGRIAQINMALEEMGELIAAINQWKRGRIDIDAVREEVADVMITAKQLAIIFGQAGVEKRYEEKINRLYHRVMNSKN